MDLVRVTLPIFTTQRYARAVYAVAVYPPSVCMY